MYTQFVENKMGILFSRFQLETPHNFPDQTTPGIPGLPV